MGIIRKDQKNEPGKLTFEPLPRFWHHSSTNNNNCQVLKENAKSLQLRPNDFSHILKKIGFVDEESLGETGEGGACNDITLEFECKR